MHSLAGSYLPLVQKLAEWLSIQASDAALHELYEFLKTNENFKEACKLAVDYGVEKAVGFLWSLKCHLVETCWENKDLMKAQTKTATKGTLRCFTFHIGTKTAVNME